MYRECLSPHPNGQVPTVSRNKETSDPRNAKKMADSLWNKFYEEEGREEKQSNGDHDYFHDYVQIMLSVGPETYLGLLAH